jgi:hypothetical protein
METILKQRFEYSFITPFKNYSKLSERKQSTNTFMGELDTIDDNLDFIFSNKKEPISTPQNVSDSMLIRLHEKNKKKTKYFYNDSEIGEKIQFFYAYLSKNKKSNTFETTKDRHIKSHFGDPFSNISIHLVERKITRNGDNITIKQYRQNKTRYVNCIYFKKQSEIESITINLKTGNFTIIKNFNGLVKQKTFRKNCFMSLCEFCTKHNSIFKTIDNTLNKDSTLYPEFESIFNEKTFYNCINEVLGFKIKPIDSITNPKNFIKELTEFFIKIKKIKVPNNYSFLLHYFYPTEKYLKKNDRKLLLSILDRFEIKSKITNKIVHTCDNVDIIKLAEICYLFGDEYPKYIGNISTNVFKMDINRLTETSNIGIFKNTYKNKKGHGYVIFDSEKENLVKILNEPMSSSNISFMYDLYEHFKMINEVRQFDPEFRMRSRTAVEYRNEHFKLSKIISSIKKGWVIEYQFNKDMVTDIEKPVTININIGDDEKPEIVNETFYPVILKTEDQYEEEGDFMHHCVSTYANKEKSVIISVRNENSSDRVTCEFDAQTGKLLQARHFCNQLPPGDFDLAIDEIKLKTSYYARRGMFGSIDKKRIPLKINGIEVEIKKPVPVLADRLFPQLPF